MGTVPVKARLVKARIDRVDLSTIGSRTLIIDSHEGELSMNAKKLLVAMILGLSSAVALAAHCPMDMQQIDAALSENPELTAEQLAKAKKHRAEGEALHKAGKHQESVAELAKAKTILGI